MLDVKSATPKVMHTINEKHGQHGRMWPHTLPNYVSIAGVLLLLKISPGKRLDDELPYYYYYTERRFGV